MPIPQRPPSPRYVVAKWDDIHRALTPRETHTLIEMLGKLARSRASRGLSDTRQYVVVSDKNRELYDEVWGMVLAEIEGQQSSHRDFLEHRLQMIRNTLAGRNAVPDSQLYSNYVSDTEEAQDETFALSASSEHFEVGQGPSVESGQFSVRPADSYTTRADMISLDEAEESFNSAWVSSSTNGSVTISDSSGARIRFGSWQPAVAVSRDSGDREPANTVVFDLETH